MSKIESFFKPNEKRGSLKRSAAGDEQSVKKTVRRSKGKKEENGPSVKSSVNVHKESLILFDEIDVVFKDDVGFWSTVTHFVKKSKKPIVITTNDEFIQERLNLNVERIGFERPRVDACVRFLVSVAARETPHVKLETSTAYGIARECRCDMRKSLVQLQALIGGGASSKSLASWSSSLIDHYKSQSRNGTLDLNQALSASLFISCPNHNHNAFFDNLFFLDVLNRRLHDSQTSLDRAKTQHSPAAGFRPYDKLIVRDGLTDNGANATPTVISFQSSLVNTNAKNQSNTSGAPKPDL